MRFRTLSTSICLGALVACSRPGITSTRHADGTRELRCEHPLWKCFLHVDDYCRGASFEVLHASDEHLAYGSEGSTVEGRLSRALIRCMKPGVSPRAWEVQTAGAAGSAAPAPRPAPAPKRACVPGSSQACVGPAACAGGQACLPDGSGFGSCDCGAPAAPVAPVAPAPPVTPTAPTAPR